MITDEDIIAQLPGTNASIAHHFGVTVWAIAKRMPGLEAAELLHHAEYTSGEKGGVWQKLYKKGKRRSNSREPVKPVSKAALRLVTAPKRGPRSQKPRGVLGLPGLRAGR